MSGADTAQGHDRRARRRPRSTAPFTLGLVAVAGTKLVRGRYRGAPDRKERRIYLLLVGWVLLAALPALIVGVSLNADPLCFSF